MLPNVPKLCDLKEYGFESWDEWINDRNHVIITFSFLINEIFILCQLRSCGL